MTSMTLVRPASAPRVMMSLAQAKSAVEEGARDGGFDVDLLPRHHAGEHGGHSDVEHGADDQRDDDADGQIALRVLGLLRGGGDGVEADVREEDVGRARADAGESVRRKGVPDAFPSWPDGHSASPGRCTKAPPRP